MTLILYYNIIFQVWWYNIIKLKNIKQIAVVEKPKCTSIARESKSSNFALTMTIFKGVGSVGAK